MAHGIPDSSSGELLKIVALLALAPAIIIGFVYVRYYSPCSWWSGMGVTDTPIRCLNVDRR